MKSFTVEITEERAFEILEAQTSLISEGMPGDLDYLIPMIGKAFPHLKERFPHLRSEMA
jgi:hypothetical protein